MKTFFKVCAAVAIAFLVGCLGGAPRWFQAKVPTPVTDGPKLIEARRKAADLIARTIEEPKVLKPVASALSTSLGAPEEPLPAATPEQLASSSDIAVAELRREILTVQRQIVALNKTLLKYQGKEIEGTGFSVLGPGVVTIIGILVALGILCPGIIPLYHFAYKRLSSAAKIVVNEIESAADAPETREAVTAIKLKVSDAMSRVRKPKQLKAVITNLKT